MFATRFLDIPPLESVAGVVRVPGSKSISNRALLLAGFASGTTIIAGLLHSDDTRVMLDALAVLGCRFEEDAANGQIDSISMRQPLSYLISGGMIPQNPHTDAKREIPIRGVKG